MTLSILSISLGAALGALLRWALSVRLNALHPMLPGGTFAANLLGGYLIGLALAWFAQHPGLSPAWRLFIVTGFLGGLTTFSTLSAEVVVHLQQARWGWAAALIALHVVGSVGMTLLGIGTVAWLRGS